jgi:hypothetical protein
VGRQLGITSPSKWILQAVSACNHHSRVLTDVTKSQLREKFTSPKIEKKLIQQIDLKLKVSNS